MAEEIVDRCYHSIALLLPDGRVLSAGSSEYTPINGTPNLPQDSKKSAQLFSPPYLFKDPGSRPTISTAPTETTYGARFDVIVGSASPKIVKVSWIRLGSVTHSIDRSQFLVFLTSEHVGLKVTVDAPLNAKIASPGHYMLFVLNEQGVPSIARIIRIFAPPVTPMPAKKEILSQRTAAPVPATVNLVAPNREIAADQGRPPVVVGVTPSCPYGIGACWGGAFDGLQRLSNIEVVRPVLDTADSTAFIYLQQDILPDLDVWRDQFAQVVNGTYTMHGIEMTLSGMVTKQLNKLTLMGTATRPDLVLAPLQATDKVQWDIKTHANKPMSDSEAGAFAQLSAALADRPAGATVQATGPLKKDGPNFFLQVREFKFEVDPLKAW